MKVHLLHARARKQQVTEMLEALGDYIKLAVDVRRGVLAAGGVLHADCEAALIDDGSQQQDIWGADWIPETDQVRYEALINIRPGQGNPSMVIIDATVRERVGGIVRGFLEGV